MMGPHVGTCGATACGLRGWPKQLFRGSCHLLEYFLNSCHGIIFKQGSGLRYHHRFQNSKFEALTGLSDTEVCKLFCNVNDILE